MKVKNCDCEPPSCPKCGNNDCEMLATESYSALGRVYKFICFRHNCGYRSGAFKTEADLLAYLDKPNDVNHNI